MRYTFTIGERMKRFSRWFASQTSCTDFRSVVIQILGKILYRGTLEGGTCRVIAFESTVDSRREREKKKKMKREGKKRRLEASNTVARKSIRSFEILLCIDYKRYFLSLTPSLHRWNLKATKMRVRKLRGIRWEYAFREDYQSIWTDSYSLDYL